MRFVNVERAKNKSHPVRGFVSVVIPVYHIRPFALVLWTVPDARYGRPFFRHLCAYVLRWPRNETNSRNDNRGTRCPQKDGSVSARDNANVPEGDWSTSGARVRADRTDGKRPSTVNTEFAEFARSVPVCRTCKTTKVDGRCHVAATGVLYVSRLPFERQKESSGRNICVRLTMQFGSVSVGRRIKTIKFANVNVGSCGE